MGKLKVTLVHSPKGKRPNQRETIRGLGLRKREQSVVVEDNDSMRGMINTVAHLVDVEQVEE